jgi:CheY-like chemotaxis protein
MIKILYDEDNEDNFYMLGGRLKAARVRDRDAPDGERGLAMAQSERPDLILMDLSLPVIDG